MGGMVRLLSSGMLAWRMNAGFDTERIQTPTAILELYNLWIIHEGPAGRARRLDPIACMDT